MQSKFSCISSQHARKCLRIAILGFRVDETAYPTTARNVPEPLWCSARYTTSAV